MSFSSTNWNGFYSVDHLELRATVEDHWLANNLHKYLRSMMANHNYLHLNSAAGATTKLCP